MEDIGAKVGSYLVPSKFDKFVKSAIIDTVKKEANQNVNKQADTVSSVSLCSG